MVLEKEIHSSVASIMLQASIAERLPDSFLVEFKWDPGQFSFVEILHEAGLVPRAVRGAVVHGRAAFYAGSF